MFAILGLELGATLTDVASSVVKSAQGSGKMNSASGMAPLGEEVERGRNLRERLETDLGLGPHWHKG